MCYNKEVSFILAFFGICCAIKEFRKNDIINHLKAFFILCLVLMQINEFVLHKYNNPNNFIHQFASLCIPITISIQVIFCLATNLILPLSNDIKITNIVMCSIFLLIMLFFMINYILPNFLKSKFNSTLLCNNNCRLKWDAITPFFNNMFLGIIACLCYYITVFSTIYLLFGTDILIITIALLLAAYLFSFTGNKKQYNHLGSMWCLLCVIFFSVVIIQY